MPKPLLHVMFSPSAAGTLRQALRLCGRSDAIAVCYDDFTFGPIPGPIAARTEGVEHDFGMTGRDDIIESNAEFLAAACSPDILPVAWMSRRDAHAYAGFLWFLSHLGNGPCRIIDVTETRRGELGCAHAPSDLVISPSLIGPGLMSRLVGTDMDLDRAARQAHLAHWRRLAAENAPLRIIDAEGNLVSAPITHFDPLLLSLATPSWQKAARIVGNALAGAQHGNVWQASGFILDARLGTLARTGALEGRGDPSSMTKFEVRLRAA